MCKNTLLLFQIILSTTLCCIICGLSPNPSISSTTRIFGITSVSVSGYENSYAQFKEHFGYDPAKS